MNTFMHASMDACTQSILLMTAKMLNLNWFKLIFTVLEFLYSSLRVDILMISRHGLISSQLDTLQEIPLDHYRAGTRHFFYNVERK